MEIQHSVITATITVNEENAEIVIQTLSAALDKLLEQLPEMVAMIGEEE